MAVIPAGRVTTLKPRTGSRFADGRAGEVMYLPRLRRSDLDAPGIRRRRRGRGWSYTDSDGTALDDPAVRARIDSLVIPPAWRDVWICPSANGHIQAVGTDAAGRRQYRYHVDEVLAAARQLGLAV